MKFKIDENLPVEYKQILEHAGLDAHTVEDENLSGRDDDAVIDRSHTESRVLLTLDLDFGNIRAYPPESFSGILIFRPRLQDKATLIRLLERLLPTLLKRSPDRQLWIVEHDRIRTRE